MSSIQNKIVDAVFENDDELTRNLVRELSYVKTRKVLGLLESNEVTVRGNDIFVGGNTVGSFETKDDKIEFTASSDGAVKTFENDEELMNYVSGLTEDVTEFKTPKIKTIDAGSEGKSDIKAPEGHDSHELASKHKDPHKENPKKNDHGHDKDQKEPTGSSDKGPKEHEHTPDSKSHSHDKDQKEPTGSSDKGPKEHEHTPDSKGHKHDDPSGLGKVEKKGK